MQLKRKNLKSFLLNDHYRVLDRPFRTNLHLQVQVTAQGREYNSTHRFQRTKLQSIRRKEPELVWQNLCKNSNLAEQQQLQHGYLTF